MAGQLRSYDRFLKPPLKRPLYSDTVGRPVLTTRPLVPLADRMASGNNASHTGRSEMRGANDGFSAWRRRTTGSQAAFHWSGAAATASNRGGMHHCIARRYFDGQV